jgi:glycosyltransferase involved in cell wall biosynthesis
MTIAVNACILPGSFADSGGHFIITGFTALAAQFPEHQFIFITDKTAAFTFPAAKNCSVIVTGPEVKTPLRLRYWLNYKLPVILLQHKADVFVSAAVCVMRTKIAQCLLINNLPFAKNQHELPKNWSRFLQNNTAKFIQKANVIAASTNFLQEQLISRYAAKSESVVLLYKNAHPLFCPLEWQQKEAVKAQYADGKEYFLYSGNISTSQNLINLLKAFSFFKKRQKSNMQLIFASTGICEETFSKSLSLYKYKTDIQLLEQISMEALTALTAAAYAVVYPGTEESFCTAAVEAMQSAVPVIASNTGSLQEICGDAALYFNAADFNDIADKMMLIFKDEDKRNELIAKGLDQAKTFSRQNSCAQLWQAVLHAIK